MSIELPKLPYAETLQLPHGTRCERRTATHPRVYRHERRSRFVVAVAQSDRTAAPLDA
jgi:hypothetical protein